MEPVALPEARAFRVLISPRPACKRVQSVANAQHAAAAYQAEEVSYIVPKQTLLTSAHLETAPTSTVHE